MITMTTINSSSVNPFERPEWECAGFMTTPGKMNPCMSGSP